MALDLKSGILYIFNFKSSHALIGLRMINRIIAEMRGTVFRRYMNIVFRKFDCQAFAYCNVIHTAFIRVICCRRLLPHGSCI